MIKLATHTTAFFGDELKRVRKASGHTVRSLSAAIGYSINQLAAWSCGDKRPPRAGAIAALAKACNVSPASLYLAAARDTGELSIDVTGLSPAEVQALLREIAEAAC